MPLGSLAELVGLPCRVRGQRIGEVVSVIVDADVVRVLGLEIRFTDDRRLFLPWVAVELDDDGVDVRSAFLLVDAGDSYTRRGARALSKPAELAVLRADDEGHVSNGVVVSIGSREGNHRR
jgi:hypothetical protein